MKINNSIKKFLIDKKETIEKAISLIKKNSESERKIRILLVVDKNMLVGTITEGDIRRFLIKSNSLKHTKVHMAMNKKPIVFSDNISLEKIKSQFPKELKKRKRTSKNYLEYFPIVNKKLQPTKILTYSELLNVTENLIDKNYDNLNKVNIYGLGYVGLTFGLFLADKNIEVHGYDIDKSKIKSLKKKKLYFFENDLNNIFEKNFNKNFFISNNINRSSKIHIVCVGTNIDKNNKIINKQLKSSLFLVSKFITKGSLVLIRSTVPVGYTEDYICKILEARTKYKSGIDFFVANIPERTLAGNAIKELNHLPQILGGINQKSINMAEQFLKKTEMDIVRVENSKIAEMAKLANNSIRDLNFAFSNELARLCEKFNIDIYKTINASNLGYPRNLISLPSPGVGGSCLTKDPFLLSKSDTKKNNIFKNSRYFNEQFLNFQLNRITKILNKFKKKKKTNILICGLAFKGFPETSDVRNSISIFFVNKLNKKNKVYVYDPVIKKDDLSKKNLNYVKSLNLIKNIDAVLFLNNNPSFNKINIKKMLSKLNPNPIIFDGWNIFDPSNFEGIRSNIYVSLSQVRINE